MEEAQEQGFSEAGCGVHGAGSGVSQVLVLCSASQAGFLREALAWLSQLSSVTRNALWIVFSV